MTRRDDREQRRERRGKTAMRLDDRALTDLDHSELSASEALLQRRQGGLEDAAADLMHQCGLAVSGAVEFRLPFGEGQIADR